MLDLAVLVVLPAGPATPPLHWMLQQLRQLKTPVYLLSFERQNSWPTVAGLRPWQIPARKQLFERAYLLNQAAYHLEALRLWIQPLELWLPFATLEERLAEQPHSLVKPFDHYRRLAPEQRLALMNQGSLPPKLEGKALGQSLGQGALIIERQLWLDSGGLHEGFVGPAEEGVEWLGRLQQLGCLPHTFADVVGYWLGPALSPADKRIRQDNAQLLERLRQRQQQEGSHYAQQHLKTSLGYQAHRAHRAGQKQHFRPLNLHPPRREPCRLPGQLWALTAYFNPAQYDNKSLNFRRFAQALRRQGVPLCAVELAFGDDPFELTTQDADLLLQLRGPHRLWQKERLLNLGLARLPLDCDKVAWLDGDILFEDPRWAQLCGEALEEYCLVQPFQACLRLKPGESFCPTENLPVGSGEHQVLHSIAYGVAHKGLSCLSNFHHHGHSGYAWAGRRQLLQEQGFYEANILGNADLNMAQAMFGGFAALHRHRLSSAAQLHLARWADSFYARVQGSVGYLPGWVYHLWHGDKVHRLYERRLDILIEEQFDPELDLSSEPQGALTWASSKPRLQQWCHDYFFGRREQG